MTSTQYGLGLFGAFLAVIFTLALVWLIERATERAKRQREYIHEAPQPDERCSITRFKEMHRVN